MKDVTNEIPIKQIETLQEYIVKKGNERGFSNETLHERLMILVEEIGELMKAVRVNKKGFIDNKFKYDGDLDGEISDILTMIFWTADKLNIDISKAFEKKEKLNNKRVWARRTYPNK
ncbi:hypothetical protein A3F07_03770 [candidate division WWE3 bacterium RIFCSPHIGHO2_12_FULL_38_15]|uniref:NTP pyrophosphohydrolase MazG-like domain-containing protein n=1 Tax=candidate division WWE3 bacterium RIFCSPHIGHO2_02_FULL_38_14 TaxID=1802620 RepID=A0A1F4V7S0_UNCKA|nr:MAG: hypothetical protein A2793_02210 [candidate division WWE3 bacterium RIFCSPHIGHO2_01_FULL_38_45]OGC48936.1 MAG: hypothetical protein A3F07_03770 [candidate division WWE3 bacterium RIFCSPHIGHO2_12_FULL_38_15]OGC52957.1 MAG: hypothetical protein A3B64_04835 [candidate division WWE3 bacterium RIFCSPLOWO2_01_FULL_37_24]OGC53242.1 MAG: hypothetical protein A3D91_02365 [candidate division WWE3 bacterium RIFCSPHIGHO2_02_FULL_38_14]